MSHASLTALVSHLETMTTFLHAMSPSQFPYSGIEEFVLREGEAMALTRKDPRVKRGTPKECFSNSTHYVLEHPDHTYVEGFVLSPKVPIAIHHAWTVNKAGLVIDPTLEWRKGSAYFGVKFATEDLLRRIRASGYYGLYCADGIRLSDLVLGLDPDFPYRGRHESQDSRQAKQP